MCVCVCVKAREGQLSRYTERKKGGREANRAYLASEVPHSLCDEPSEHLSRGCQAPAKVPEAQRLLGVRALDYQRSALSRGLRVQRECVPDLTIVVCHLLAAEQAPRRAPSVNDHLSRRFEGLPLRHHSCPRRARCPQFVCLVRPTRSMWVVTPTAQLLTTSLNRPAPVCGCWQTAGISQPASCHCGRWNGRFSCWKSTSSR